MHYFIPSVTQLIDKTFDSRDLNTKAEISSQRMNI
jgi:hypothetical protein